MATMTAEPKVLKLVAALKLAEAAALAADCGQDEGGTCHCDSVQVKLPRWTDTQVKAAADLSGLSIGDKGGSGYWAGFRTVGFTATGQGLRSERMIDAAYKALHEAALPDGAQVRHYQQTD